MRVCGRGADTFECLEHMLLGGHGFVLRSCQNRALEVGDGNDGPTLLHDRLRALPGQAEWAVGVSGRPGR